MSIGERHHPDQRATEPEPAHGPWRRSTTPRLSGACSQRLAHRRFVAISTIVLTALVWSRQPGLFTERIYPSGDAALNSLLVINAEHFSQAALATTRGWASTTWCRVHLPPTAGEVVFDKLHLADAVQRADRGDHGLRDSDVRARGGLPRLSCAQLVGRRARGGPGLRVRRGQRGTARPGSPCSTHQPFCSSWPRRPWSARAGRGSCRSPSWRPGCWSTGTSRFSSMSGSRPGRAGRLVPRPPPDGPGGACGATGSRFGRPWSSSCSSSCRWSRRLSATSRARGGCIAFSRDAQNDPRTASRVVAYVAKYWTETPWPVWVYAVAGFVLVLLLAVDRRRRRRLGYAWVAGMLVLQSALAVFYAYRGIDHLEPREVAGYVLMYYQMVPLLLVLAASTYLVSVCVTAARPVAVTGRGGRWRGDRRRAGPRLHIAEDRRDAGRRRRLPFRRGRPSG